MQPRTIFFYTKTNSSKTVGVPFLPREKPHLVYEHAAHLEG